MSEIILRQDFEASAERVFDALADQDKMSSWMGGKISVPVRGENGLVGTVRRVHVGSFTLDERIVEAERPRHIAYKISSAVPLLAHHHGELQIESLGANQARVTWRVEMELKPAFIGAFVRPALSRMLASGLKRLAGQLHS